jgi:high-affinity Fe2+/Pb2+ permease
VIKSQFLNIRDWPFGAATSITLTVVMGLMLLIYWRAARLLNKRWNSNDRSTAARRLYDRHLCVSLYPDYYSDRELV